MNHIIEHTTPILFTRPLSSDDMYIPAILQQVHLDNSSNHLTPPPYCPIDTTFNVEHQANVEIYRTVNVLLGLDIETEITTLSSNRHIPSTPPPIGTYVRRQIDTDSLDETQRFVDRMLEYDTYLQENIHHRPQQSFTKCNDSYQCTICLEKQIGGGVKLKCGHIFHQECISMWFNRKNSCPTCRYTD
jgi:hypothetical protein